MENIFSIYAQAFHSYGFPPLHLAEPLARERERALVSASASARAREGEGDEGGERRGVAVASYDIYRKFVARNFFSRLSMDLNVEASAAHKRTFMDFLDPDVSSSVIFLAPLVFVSASFICGSLDLTLAFPCI